MKSLNYFILKYTPCFFLLLFALNSFADTLWIDVRSNEEYASDHIAGDINIPFTSIATNIEKYTKDKNTEIQVYCKSGGRAGAALLQLKAMGYKNAHNAGGIAEVRANRKLTP